MKSLRLGSKIVLSKKEVSLCRRIGFERNKRTVQEFRIQNPHPRGGEIHAMGVMGEYAFAKLHGLNSAHIHDTTPRNAFTDTHDFVIDNMWNLDVKCTKREYHYEIAVPARKLKPSILARNPVHAYVVMYQDPEAPHEFTLRGFATLAKLLSSTPVQRFNQAEFFYTCPSDEFEDWENVQAQLKHQHQGFALDNVNDFPPLK